MAKSKSPKVGINKGKAESDMATSDRSAGPEASRKIDQRIKELNDWRGQTLSQVRQLILAAHPDIQEEWKWMGTPVWSCQGNLCTGETYKEVVKLTFARGAFLPDPSKLFNSSLEGNLRRAIDIREGEAINAKALQSLIRAAIKENQTQRAAKSTKKPNPLPAVKKKSSSQAATPKSPEPKVKPPSRPTSAPSQAGKRRSSKISTP